MADLNEIADNPTEEQMDIADVDMSVIELEKNIKQGKIRFDDMRSIVDYVNAVKKVVDLRIKARFEDRGKMHASLWGDPRDVKSRYKGQIGILERFFDNAYLSGSEGESNMKRAVNSFKSYDLISNEMLELVKDTNDKLLFIIQVIIDTYQKDTEQLERKISEFRNRTPTENIQPVVEEKDEFLSDHKNKSAREIVDEFMLMYGDSIMQNWIQEVKLNNEFSDRAIQIQNIFISHARSYLRTYYEDAEKRSKQLFDAVGVTYKKKIGVPAADNFDKAP